MTLIIGSALALILSALYWRRHVSRQDMAKRYPPLKWRKKRPAQ